MARGNARTAIVVAIALLTAGGVACGGQDDAASGETVEVTLKDFELTVSPESVGSGAVTLQATNDGPTTHEFEIFSGAEGVDLDSLPIENDVADTTGLTLVDEVEDVTPGTTADLVVDLQTGTYAVVCNLPEHYAQGMHATLTVT